MLVLTRSQDQSIMIDGSTIEVKVFSVRGGRVRIGIRAPREIPIRRKELRIAPPAAGDSEGGFLVLSRLKGEAILIGDEIELVLVEIRGNKARIGTSAPRRISVHRREVWEGITSA